ncbi:MAG: cephalosporin hydroxylase family protein [Planctomycetaceae bacterium]|nr:cephalosporin hydroxylase family protein [Planctomycetaceae bacterium]
MWEFLKTHSEFEIDKFIENKLLRTRQIFEEKNSIRFCNRK